MKIGIDIRLIGKKRTGDEAVFFNLVKNLAEIDQNNEYFLFTDRDLKEDIYLAEEIKKLNLGQNFQVIFVKKTNRFCWNLWHLPAYLKRHPVDVFHTQYIAPFWLPKKVKLVLTIHDVSFKAFSQFIKFSDLFFLKRLIPRSLKMATKIIAVSEFTKKEIEKYYKVPSEKIVAIHNGIDFDLFNQTTSQEKLTEVRKKYDLPEKFILYIGTLQPRKNIPALIEAIKILSEKYNMRDLKLVIAGNRKAHNFDPKIDEIIKKYNLEKSVVFSGWVDEEDKPALYKLAQCFVFPSLYEGFGIPIVEAMAAGTPVVSSNSSCLLEVGRGGAIYIDPKNPEELAEKTGGILSDKNARENLIEKGKEIAKSYSWKENAKETLAVYESISR